MDIGFFSKQLPSDAPNGVSCQVHRLANALVNLGDSVTCYSFSPPPPDALYRHIPLSYGCSSALRRKIIPALAFRRLSGSNHDILHYHGDDFLCKGGKRRVRTFYGSAYFEARFARTARRFLYQLTFYLFEWLSCLRRGSKTGISRVTTRALPLVKNVVPCCVPLERYTPGEEKTSAPSLLFIGDLNSRKRGGFIVEIFQRVIVKRFPTAVLTIVGPEKVDGSGIVYAGVLSEDDLIETYRKSWVHCTVSSYEGFGVPMVEAMACGAAVAAVDNSGAREIVTHEHNGLLCTDAKFCETLCRLLSDDALRQRLVANGLSTVQKFDSTVIARRYRELYCKGRNEAYEK